MSEQVLLAATGNQKYDKDIMTLFPDRARGDDSIVPEKMIEGAAGNLFHGAAIMTLFFGQRKPS